MARRNFLEPRDRLLNQEGFSSLERAFLMGVYSGAERDVEVARLVSEFRLVRAMGKEAAANEKYSSRMVWLTIALGVAAFVEGFSTLAQVLIELGVIGCLPG